MFSYLLMICGLFGLAVGGVVIYGALADGAAAATGLPLSALVLGVAAAVANGITIAAGVLGRAASRNPGRAAALRSLALAGVVASVFGLGLCYATGGQLPTSLIFNLLLMAICVVIAGTWGNRPNSSPAALADTGSNTVYCDPRAARCWPCCLRRNYD